MPKQLANCALPIELPTLGCWMLDVRCWSSSPMLNHLIAELAHGRSLSSAEVSGAIEELIAETVPPDLKADFLTALARKGESVEELAAFADGLRQKAVKPEFPEGARPAVLLDVCGTGGDMQNTFNISTAVAV